MSYASVLLDMPPSANKMWRKGPFGMHPSADYKTWKNQAGQEVMIARKGLTFEKPVHVTIIMKQGHKGRDIDNQIKPILDALQFGQMLKNDNIVRSLAVRWAQDFDLPALNERDVKVEVRAWE